MSQETTTPIFDTTKGQSKVDAVINQELYDAEAVQEIEFTDGEDFTVICSMKPVSDTRYLQFAEDSKTQLVDEASAIVVENTKACINLWNDQCSDIQGFNGERPSNWKDLVDEINIKIPTALHYLAVAAIEGDKGTWDASNTIKTESYFGNKILVQKHFLRKRTPDDVKIYRKFQKMPLGKQKGLKSSVITLQNFAEQKAKLYDQMCVKDAEGYVSHVPIWHKIAVIDAEFANSMNAKK